MERCHHQKQVGDASLVCFIAWVASVYDYTLFGTLLLVIAEDFGWSAAKATAINTWATIGVFVASLVVGDLYLGQTLGPNSGDVM